jgi:hypothetical protein
MGRPKCEIQCKDDPQGGDKISWIVCLILVHSY